MADPDLRWVDQRGYFYTPPRPAAAPPSPPWRVWEALAIVLVFSASQPISSLLASALLSQGMPAHFSVAQAETALLKIVLPLVIVVSHAVGWLGAWWLVSRRHGQRFLPAVRLTGLRRFRKVRVFLAGMALQIVSVVFAALLPPPPELSNPMLRFLAFGGWAVALLFVMAVLMAPFLEEVLFRGILLPALRRRIGFLPAASIVTALFAGLHAVQTGGYLPALAAIALVGFLLAWLREASGSLWPPVIFHMGFNFTALLPVLLLGGALPESIPGLG